MIIELSNFMSHDTSRVELPARGVVMVTGPNGAGKSAIIEGIATAMWGRGLRGRWSPWRPEPGYVVLEDGDLHVNRVWTGKAKSLEWGVGNNVTAFDTTTKAQEALEASVGLFDVWRRTCVFSAADAAHFTQATDAERKELLETLLGLGWFERALTECRRDLRSAETSRGHQEREFGLAEAKATGLASGIKDAQETLGQLGAGQVGFLRVETAKLAAHLNDIRKEQDVLRERRLALKDVGGADRERAQAVGQRLAKLSGGGCPLCGQDVDDALRSRLRGEATTALKDAATARDAATAELERSLIDLGELQDEAAGLEELLTKARDELTGFEKTRRTRELVEKSLTRQTEEAAVQADRMQKATAAIEKLHADVAELEACERVLGVRGARAHVVGRTLTGIETLANGWLARLSSSIIIQLRPYTEKKSGGTVDAISLNIVGAGGESGYLGASAGERRRVDVALLLALAELASGTSNGAQWRSPIFFDEVFDSLDADGREAVGDLVQQLAIDRCVVLITHDEAVASVRADLRIRIDDGCVL